VLGISQRSGFTDRNFCALDGNTPLEEASIEGHTRVINLLIYLGYEKMEIKEQVLKVAPGNSENGKEVMTLLLDRRGDGPPGPILPSYSYLPFGAPQSIMLVLILRAKRRYLK
jgi:hypothetical protein